MLIYIPKKRGGGKKRNFFLCGGLSHDEVTLIAQETPAEKECRPVLRCLVVY